MYIMHKAIDIIEYRAILQKLLIFLMVKHLVTKNIFFFVWNITIKESTLSETDFCVKRNWSEFQKLVTRRTLA